MKHLLLSTSPAIAEIEEGGAVGRGERDGKEKRNSRGSSSPPSLQRRLVGKKKKEGKGGV